MILLITREDDVHADMVVKALRVRGAPYFRLNTEVVHDYAFSVGVEDGRIRNTRNNLTIAVSEVRCVYFRRQPVPQNVPVDPSDAAFVEREWKRCLRNLWALLDNRFWISHYLALERARDKLLQLQVAQSAGFLTPETLVTNDIASLKEFHARHGKIIYKPFDGGIIGRNADRLIYTSVVTNEILASEATTASLRICPGLFQPYIDKDYEVRVTVVGDQVFATKIDSQASEHTRIDWRNYDFQKVKHEALDLPRNIEDRCREMVRRLNLQFGAIDLIVTPEDQFFFLEVNANGQWAWLEMLTRQPIATAIAEHLIRHVS